MSFAGQISLLAARIATEIKANKTAIALKAPIASPQFTGIPKGVTPAAGDNSTNIATTAFVGTALKQILADPGEAATPASFPDGISLISVASGAWSIATDSMTVMTLRAGSDFRVTQTAHIKTSGDVYSRVSQGSGTGTWNAWSRLADFGDLAAYATIDSPTFTGVPASVTPGTNSNSTTIATTAFVKALGYAPLTGGTFTGPVYSPTPPSTDNGTRLATTAFVNTAINNGQPDLSVYAKKASPTFSGTVTMTQFTSANGGVTGTLTVPNIDAGNNQLALTGSNSSGASPGDLLLNNDGVGPRVSSQAVMNRIYTQASSNGVSSSTLLAVVTNAGTIGALNGGLFLPDVYSRNRSGQRTMLIQSDGSMGTSSSSIRVKNTHAQVVMDDTMLDAWTGLPTWTFDYKEDPDHHEHTGVIAEEVQAAGYFDDLIYYDERPAEQGGVPGQVDGFAYERMGVWNRLAIKRLLERVKELEARIPA